MRGQSVRNRDQVVRDFARLTLDGPLSEETGRAIVEAAIEEEVTITEVLRETTIIKSGGPIGRTPRFTPNESEDDWGYLYGLA
jgi:hypothetical protein